MKQMFRAAVVAAAVLAVPAMSLAAQAQAAGAPAKSAAKTTAVTKTKAPTVHSATGVVKSIDASSLVLSETAGKKKGAREVRFVLEPSTQKDGNIAAGSTVRVKYHNDAKKHVATDVRVAGGKKS